MWSCSRGDHVLEEGGNSNSVAKPLPDTDRSLPASEVCIRIQSKKKKQELGGKALCSSIREE